MADTTTTNLGLTKPEIGAAEDTWGISLNNDLDAIDAIFSATGTAVSLNIDGGDIASAVTINKSPVITLGGDLTGNVTLTNLASGTLTASLASSISPTFQNLTLSGTDSIKVPAGTTAQRNGSPVNGMLRYNSTTNEFEGYQNSAWGALGGGSSTTINNNADNRVITGSGTANTLEAEANLTYDGSTLSIAGDVSVTGTTPTITIGDGDAENTALVFDGNAQDYYLGLYDTSDSIVIGRGNSVGTNRNFEINSSGNVGIGFTPNSWVSGDIILQGKSGTSAWNIWGRNNTVRFGLNHYFNGANYVYQQDGGATSYEQSASSTNGMHTWHAADQGTAGNTFTNAEKMRLLDGNLMLGTTTTNIAGLTSTTNTILAIKNSGGSTDTADLRLDGPGGGIINFGDDNVRTGLLFSDNVNFFEMATRVAKPLIFSPNSSEAMRMHSNGNVSIGGTSDQPLGLTIAGTLLAVDESSDSAGIQLDGGTGARIDMGIGGTAYSKIFTDSNIFELKGVTNAPMLFGTNNTERMRILGGGNVGIGTTTPGEKLEVSGSVSISTDLKFNSGFGSAGTAYGVRAWVNFNGSGTVSIRGNGNVSSITDNGTGDYTLNFSNSMPDTNYTTIGSGGLSSGNLITVSQPINLASPATGSVRIQVPYQNGLLFDAPYVGVLILR
jgi:hypothetical protein